MTNQSARQRIWVQPTGAALGADVHGLDLSRRLQEQDKALIAQAWSEHLVLRFSGQRLSDDELVTFSRHFGQLDNYPGYKGNEHDAMPEITRISNVVVDGRAIGGLGYGEAAWHTDMSYQPMPPRASVLYALECPPDGGSTWFCNMYQAFSDLPPDTKKSIERLSCHHDASRDSTGRLREGFTDVDDPRCTPGVCHPLVRVHPVTGRYCLFLGRRAGAYIPELPLEQSNTLLDRLWEHATQDKYVWKQHWRVADLIMWDNRCVLHRRDAFDNRQRRLMHRTQIVGERVVGPERFRTTDWQHG